eukprot:scaffold34510_cov52-Phaeocystis_antarctica.AAC.3
MEKSWEVDYELCRALLLGRWAAGAPLAAPVVAGGVDPRAHVLRGRGGSDAQWAQCQGGGALHNLHGLNRGVAVDAVAAAVHGRVAQDGHPVGAQALVEWVWPLLPSLLNPLVGGLPRRDKVAVQQEEDGHQTAHDEKVDADDRR